MGKIISCFSILHHEIIIFYDKVLMTFFIEIEPTKL